MYTYGPALKLYPFIFQDLLDSLEYNPTTNRGFLLAEVFGSLLFLACKEYQSKFDANTGLNRYAQAFPTQDIDGKWSQDNDESDLIGTLAEAYSQLTIHERAAVDQWYKWRPGQWLHLAPVDNKDSNPHFKLKAWPVALFGLIRDWFQGDPAKIKWQILHKLLFTEISNEVDGTAFESVDSATVSITSTNSTETSRKRKPEASTETEGNEVAPKRSTRSRVPPKAPAKVTKVAKPKTAKNETKAKANKNSKSKKVNEMQFDDLCARVEHGFMRLTPDEKVLILNFLTDTCVLETDPIRMHRDYCGEKVTELKKEQRELQRSKKATVIQIAELSKKLPGINLASLLQEITSVNQGDADDIANSPRSSVINREVMSKEEIEALDSIIEAKRIDAEQDRREQIVMYEIRRDQGAARIKPMGKDRYCNRYWWLDGALGAVSMQSITSLGNIPQSVPDPIITHDFATGYLFVEEFINDYNNLPAELFEPTSSLRSGTLDGKWGVYSNPEQVYCYLHR